MSHGKAWERTNTLSIVVGTLAFFTGVLLAGSETSNALARTLLTAIIGTGLYLIVILWLAWR